MSSAVPQLLFVRRVLRLVWCVLGIVFLTWIVSRNIPLNGRVAVEGRTGEPNGFIGGFTPLDRAVPTRVGERWVSDIGGEPVYFHLAAPRLYDTMRVQLRYKAEGQPYIALGARADLAEWSFDLKPIDVPLLDAAGWAARQDGELRVYEKKATTRSVQEILASGNRVALLGLDPVRWGLHLPALASEKTVEAVMNETGSRTLYVYVQHGPLELSLGLRGPEKSEARVTLVREGKTILTRTHRGDGAVQLSLTGAEAGLYRVQLDAPDDVSLIGVTSRQSRVMLLDTDGEHLHAPPGATRFDPEFPVVTWETDLKKSPYDAIVARYHPPTVDPEGWTVASTEFNLHDVAAAQGRVQMVLSLPAIKAVGGNVRVDAVQVEYQRPPIDFKKLLELIKIKL